MAEKFSNPFVNNNIPSSGGNNPDYPINSTSSSASYYAGNDIPLSGGGLNPNYPVGNNSLSFTNNGAPVPPKKESNLPVIIITLVTALIIIAITVVVTLIITGNQDNSVGNDKDGVAQTKDKDDDSDDGSGDSDSDDAITSFSSLQMSQRDSLRVQDVSRLAAAVVMYQSNNEGSLPAMPGENEMIYVTGSFARDGLYVKGSSNSAVESWGNFYNKYILIGSVQDYFSDPKDDSEQTYNLEIVNCNAGNDGVCSTQPAKFDEQKGTILIIVGASCKAEPELIAVQRDATDSSPRVVVMYAKESSEQAICIDV